MVRRVRVLGLMDVVGRVVGVVLPLLSVQVRERNTSFGVVTGSEVRHLAESVLNQ